MGLNQVVQLAESPLTGSQVSSASSQLCRDGQLVRIRAGVYLWADGIHAKRSHPTPAAPTSPIAIAAANRPVAAELFEQLFPRGVGMTGEILADFERWAQLTEKLAAHAS